MILNDLNHTLEEWRIEHDLPPFLWEKFDARLIGSDEVPSPRGEALLRLYWKTKNLDLTLSVCTLDTGEMTYGCSDRNPRHKRDIEGEVPNIEGAVQWLKSKGLDIRPEPERWGMPVASSDTRELGGRMWGYKEYHWIRYSRLGNWEACTGWGKASFYPTCEAACAALKKALAASSTDVGRTD